MKRLYYNQGITIEVSQTEDSETVSTLPEVAFSPEIEELCDALAAIVARILDASDKAAEERAPVERAD